MRRLADPSPDENAVEGLRDTLALRSGIAGGIDNRVGIDYTFFLVQALDTCLRVGCLRAIDLADLQAVGAELISG